MITSSSQFSIDKSKIFGFTLIELLIVMVIIGVLASIGGSSFLNSLQRSRDARRKSDLNQIQKALEVYYNDYNQYPLSQNGEIMGCGVSPCTAGEAFEDDNGTVYMVELPDDPSERDYFYFSDGEYYQIYARLENLEDRDINKDAEDNPQVYSGTDCQASDDCNYGVSSANALPLDNRSLIAE